MQKLTLPSASPDPYVFAVFNGPASKGGRGREEKGHVKGKSLLLTPESATRRNHRGAGTRFA